MTYPSVHLITLNWNGLADTRECLNSIRQSTYQHLRVFVVDNASANNEAEALESEFPEVVVLKQAENLGFCGGCNVGMRTAMDEGADYILLVNNDTILPPDLIGNLVEAYRKLPSPGAISPVILRYPETDKVWFSIARWETSWKRGEAGFRLALDDSYETLKTLSPYPSEFACGCCLFVSRAVIERIGYFDERYFAYYDEAEWCARMKREGLTSYMIPTAYMYHKVGRSVPTPAMTYLMTRNRLLWMSENLDVAQKARSYPPMLKDLIWHFLNLSSDFRRSKNNVSRQSSRVILQGWKDYFLKRFGKWGAETEKLIFNK